MTSPDDYLQDVVNVFASITQSSEFVEEPVINVPGNEIGILTFGLEFLDKSLLFFTATVDLSPGYPAYANYSIHYQDRLGHCIFRYDNAPHYPQLAPFPQHKHVGKEEHPANGALPSIRQIANEIQEILVP